MAGGVRRMMVSKEQRASIPFRLHAGQGRPEEAELRVADGWIGDDSRVLECVAVDRQNTYEWRFERVEDARLDLCGSREAACFRRHDERPRTEVPQEGVECLRLTVGGQDAVMVAGHCQDGRGIVAIWVVELIVVVLSFTEAV